MEFADILEFWFERYASPYAYTSSLVPEKLIFQADKSPSSFFKFAFPIANTESMLDQKNKESDVIELLVPFKKTLSLAKIIPVFEL